MNREAKLNSIKNKKKKKSMKVVLDQDNREENLTNASTLCSVLKML